MVVSSVNFKVTTPTIFAKITPNPYTFYKVISDNDEQLYFGSKLLSGIADLPEATNEQIQALLQTLYTNN